MVVFNGCRIFCLLVYLNIMALSLFSRTNASTNTNNDGVLSLPSARAILLASVGCMMVLSLLMVASASIPFALSRGLT